MSSPSGFYLPNLFAHCSFPAIYHTNADAIVRESDKWIANRCINISPSLRRALPHLMSGELASFCYNNCDDERLRIVCDFMVTLFLLDDLTDDLETNGTELYMDIIMNAMADPASYRPGITNGHKHPLAEPDASRLTRDYWLRMRAGSSPQVQARIIQGVKEYLIAVRQQAEDRRTGDIPSLDAYIEHRRMSSGCKPLFDIIEFSLDMTLPEEVVNHPLMALMKDSVNDWVAFSNDLYSFKVEHARGDTHNMVAVMMRKYNLDIQTAVDRVGDICIKAMDKYLEAKAQFPSYGPEVDRNIESYLHVMQSWMSGCMAWSFVTPRYLGSKRNEIRKHRWVDLNDSKPAVRSANAA